MRHSPEQVFEAVQRCLHSGSSGESEAFVNVTRGIIEAAIGCALRQWNAFHPATAEDLVQEVYVTLCGNGYSVLRKFQSDRPEALIAYLKTIAASAAVDYLRAKAAQKRGQGRAPESLDGVEHLLSSTDSEADLQRGILLGQVDRCLKSNAEVPGRDRRIFWLYYRQGISSRAISQLTGPELSQKGVESVIQRMIRVVRQCLELAERKTGGIPVKKGR